MRIFILFFFLAACQAPTYKNESFYYASAGYTKYFLSDLPQWAHFSSSAQCMKPNVRYLDYEKLKENFGLSYVDFISLQLFFNKDIAVDGLKVLSPQEEEQIFSKSMALVKGGEKVFKNLNYPLVNLVWIDEVIKDKKNQKSFNVFINSIDFNQGFPVFVSLCRSFAQVEEFIKSIKYDGRKEIISAEMFSLYDTKGIKTFSFHLDLQDFLGERKSRFYLPKGAVTPLEIRGSNSLFYY
ncbi:MAG: hypothetical protein KBD63_05440 [Bacteriovoracaceae bacterium]|nr:hypothetical protein [Bacteriovoracaceae bacterium]